MDKNIWNKKVVIAISSILIIGGSTIGLIYFSPIFDENENETRTIIDMTGNSVTIPQNVETVAAGRTTLMEILIMLDREKIAAFSDADSLPWMRAVFPGIVDVPRGFTYSDVIIESLMEINPDVVFVCIDDPPVETIIQAGLTVVQVSRLTDEDFMKSVLIMGEVLGGEAVNRAESYVNYYNFTLDFIHNRTKDLNIIERPSVTFLNGIIPDLQAYTLNSYMNCNILLAGGKNGAFDLTIDKDKVIISGEQLLSYNPDIIMACVLCEDYEAFLIDGRWQEMDAIKNNTVYIVPRGVWGNIGGGGVGVVEMPFIQLWMSTLIQPTIFNDIDVIIELKEFFSNFFNYNLRTENATCILNAMAPLC